MSGTLWKTGRVHNLTSTINEQGVFSPRLLLEHCFLSWPTRIVSHIHTGSYVGELMSNIAQNVQGKQKNRVGFETKLIAAVEFSQKKKKAW